MPLFNNWFDYGVGGAVCIVAVLLLWRGGKSVLKLLDRTIDNQTKPVGSNSDLHRAVRKPARGPDEDSNALRFHRRDLQVTDHYFFSTVDNLVGLKVSSLRCGCDGRTALLRAILSVYLTHWRDALRAFCISESQRDDFDSTNINNAVTLETRLNDVILATTKKINDTWKTSGVPDDATRIFFRWHGALTEILVENSRKVASSPFFSTNRERLISLLAAHTVALSYTINDSRIVLKRMNGKLDGAEFAGWVIEPIDPHITDDYGTDPPFETPPAPPSNSGVRRSGEHRLDRKR